jgi:hypothetical protein
MGGHAHLQFELLQVWILDMQEPLLSTQHCDLKGLLFQAVTDTGVTEAALTDSKFNNLNKYQRAVEVQLSTAPDFPLGSDAVHTFTSTTLPGKYYINMALSFSDVSAVNGASVAAAVRAFSSAVVRFSPSSASAETSTPATSSEPLKLWDRLRSLVHGSVRLLSDKLTYTQLLSSSSSASGNSSDNSSSSSSSVQLSAVSVQFMYTLGHVSCDMPELALTVPLTVRQQKGDPPQPLQSPFHSPFGSGNLAVGTGTLSISENDVLGDCDDQQQLEFNANANNSNIPRKQCIAYIPSLHVACGLTWECANKQVSKPLHFQQFLALQTHTVQRLIIQWNLSMSASLLVCELSQYVHCTSVSCVCTCIVQCTAQCVA